MTNASKEPNITDEAREGPPHDDIDALADSIFKKLLPLLASIAGLTCTGVALFNCNFLQRDFYVTPQDERGALTYFLYGGGCEEYFTVEECIHCYDHDCELTVPPIVPEDHRKESQGIGFWNMERFYDYCGSCDTPDLKKVPGGPSCQYWPKDAVEDFDGYWFYGRITSLVAFSLGVLACVTLVYLACTRGMMVKPFVICLHLAAGVFTILLLIAIKSDLCDDSGVALVGLSDFEFEFPVAGCHAGIGKKLVPAAFCLWMLGAIGVLLAYKDPNEPSILEEWAKITAAARATKQKTNVAPHPEEEKEDMPSASSPTKPIADATIGPVGGVEKV